MPIDVAPATGEPHWSTTTDLCSPPVNNVPQTRTHNPRDGLVTFIAATQGEEGFTDLNGNGQWDQGEPFFDLGEPYADSNDNNEWDPGEPYIDVNGNGQYDGPNGKWDSNTTIWTVGHVMYTDAPNAWWFDAAGALVTKLPSVDDGSSEPFSVEWRDDNLNVSAPAFATYTLGLVAPAGGSVALTGLPAFVDSFGSVGVGAPTTCVTPGTSPICSQSTEIQFFDPYSTDLNLPMSSFDMVEGLYTAPAAAMMGASPAGTDTIEATALTTVGTGVVTVISTETVDFSGGP